MDSKTQRMWLAASVVGILAAAGATMGRTAHAQDEEAAGEAVHCYGINKCKGTGDCGGTGHSCAGQNACQGHGFIELDEDDCLRIQGGRLSSEAQ